METITQNPTENGQPGSLRSGDLLGAPIFRRGRGSNPASRANLKTAKRDYCVVLLDGGKWHYFSGPHLCKIAWRKQGELSRTGHTAGVKSGTPQDWVRLGMMDAVSTSSPNARNLPRDT